MNLRTLCEFADGTSWWRGDRGAIAAEVDQRESPCRTETAPRMTRVRHRRGPAFRRKIDG
jgi:hypothetical protein